MQLPPARTIRLGGGPTRYWPPLVPRVESAEAFAQAFAELGYERCATAGFEQGVEKIAVYVGSNGAPKHAASQLSDAKWTSKLGKLEDITHGTPAAVSNEDHGMAAVFFRRPRRT